MTNTILIADDEPNILLSLEYLMKREGFDVHVAHDGDETMALLHQLHPRLLLLDVVMPGRDGYQVCQALRADDTLHNTRVLMLSAKGRDTDVAKGLAMGADAYLTKPFASQALVAKVRELLASRP